MKRIQTVLSLLFIMVCLTGCEDNVSLTEEQNDLIAEYAANEVLQRNPDYEERLDRVKDASSDASGNPESTTEEQTTEELTTEAPLDAFLTAPAGDTSSDDMTQTSTVSNMSELYSRYKLEVNYTGYKLTDSYQDSDDKSLAVEPINGGKLLVVKLGVKNLSDGKNNVDLLDAGYQYTLKTPTGSYTSLLTLVDSDFSVYQKTLKKNATKKAVLLFEVPKTAAKPLDGYTLHITNGTADVDVVIQ